MRTHVAYDADATGTVVQGRPAAHVLQLADVPGAPTRAAATDDALALNPAMGASGAILSRQIPPAQSLADGGCGDTPQAGTGSSWTQGPRKGGHAEAPNDAATSSLLSPWARRSKQSPAAPLGGRRKVW
jgi:hypothetical protein